VDWKRQGRGQFVLGDCGVKFWEKFRRRKGKHDAPGAKAFAAAGIGTTQARAEKNVPKNLFEKTKLAKT